MGKLGMGQEMLVVVVVVELGWLVGERLEELVLELRVGLEHQSDLGYLERLGHREHLKIS